MLFARLHLNGGPGGGVARRASVPIRLVRLTLPSSTTREISLSGGGLNTHLSEVALWLQSSPLTAILLDLLTVPFNATTDFTVVLADYCARFAETLIETDDPALRLALCGRFSRLLRYCNPLRPHPHRILPKA